MNPMNDELREAAIFFLVVERGGMKATKKKGLFLKLEKKIQQKRRYTKIILFCDLAEQKIAKFRSKIVFSE